MKKNTGKRLILYLFGGQKGRMSAVLASILLSTLAALAAPFVLAKAIDHIYGYPGSGCTWNTVPRQCSDCGQLCGQFNGSLSDKFYYEICGAVHYVIRI
ncbi:hypothetical protein [Lacrimispora xylanisolvens]|uniref:hypothetical protein n=1 Tax=Lacrimispora xylanisolvens TaxID=384636 RepID=UPI002402C992